MATSVLGLKTFTASDPVDYNEVNDNYNKIDNGVKTAMQGRAAHNLLDNSYFKIKREIVNQRGETSYSGGGYTIDRWILYDPSGDGSLVINDGYISLTGGTGAVSLSCRFPKGIIDANKTYTKVFCDNQGNINPCSVFFYDSFDSFEISAGAGVTKNIVWAAMYEGSYTASTLPAYQPKGYAAELAECQRYYYQSWDGSKFNKGYITREAISASSLALIEFPTEMRIVPTITFYTAANETGVVKEWTTSSSVSATQKYTSTKAFGVNCGSNFTIGKTYFFHYTASADL